MKFPKGPRVRVKVQKELITKAIAANSSKCWIAESIKAQIPVATHVAVDLATTRFTDPERGLRYVYLTPYSAQLALLAFDEGKTPEPFAFLLKNAHVSRAKGQPRVPSRDPKITNRRTRENLKRRIKTAERAQQAVSGPATFGSSVGGAAVPARVGGRRPPQLRMIRKFGIRAFRGSAPPKQATAPTTAHR